MFLNDDANDAVLCVVIRVEMCCFYLGESMKYFLIYESCITEHSRRSLTGKFSLRSECATFFFLWKASAAQLKNAFFNRQMKKRLLGDSLRYA